MAVMDRRQPPPRRDLDASGTEWIRSAPRGLKHDLDFEEEQIEDTFVADDDNKTFEPDDNNELDEPTLRQMSESMSKINVGLGKMDKKGLGGVADVSVAAASPAAGAATKRGVHIENRAPKSAARPSRLTSIEDDDCVEPQPFRFENIRTNPRKKRYFDDRESIPPQETHHVKRLLGGKGLNGDAVAPCAPPDAYSLLDGKDRPIWARDNRDLQMEDDDTAFPPDSMSQFGVDTDRRPMRTLRRNLRVQVPSNDEPVEVFDLIFSNDGTYKDHGFQIGRGGIQQTPGNLSRVEEDTEVYDDAPSSRRKRYVVKNINELRYEKVLGRGACGQVMMGRHLPTNTPLAVKIIDVSAGPNREQLLKELSTLITHNNPHLVRFYEAFYNGASAVHIVLEFMDCGSLKDVVERNGSIPEPVVQLVALHCIRGLRFLHQRSVLHRDLKSANILLSAASKRVKLSDFGLAKNLGESRQNAANTYVGTPAYMSPERLDALEYTYASDIWALGITIAEALLGKYPFEQRGAYDEYLLERKNILLDADKFSPEACDFIKRSTDVKPSNRPTAEELIGHPWLSQAQIHLEVFWKWLQDTKADRHQSQHHSQRVLP